MWQKGFHSRSLWLNAGRQASVARLAVSPHLNEVVQDGFVGQVTAEAVVPLQEVRSEMVQEGVEVQGVVTVLPAVNTLAALQNTHNSPPRQLHSGVVELLLQVDGQTASPWLRHKEDFSVYRRGSASV